MFILLVEVFPDSWVVPHTHELLHEIGPLALSSRVFLYADLFSDCLDLLPLDVLTSSGPLPPPPSPQWICWDLLGFTLLMIQSKTLS